MLPGGWGGICHLTRPTAGRVGAREWLSGDGEGQMMLAERVGFLVLWRVLLPRGAAANSVTGSGGFGFPPVRRVGAFAPQVWHTCVGPEGHGERLLGIIPTGVSKPIARAALPNGDRRPEWRGTSWPGLWSGSPPNPMTLGRTELILSLGKLLIMS